MTTVDDRSMTRQLPDPPPRLALFMRCDQVTVESGERSFQQAVDTDGMQDINEIGEAEPFGDGCALAPSEGKILVCPTLSCSIEEWCGQGGDGQLEDVSEGLDCSGIRATYATYDVSPDGDLLPEILWWVYLAQRIIARP
jgi:hypothetical protein